MRAGGVKAEFVGVLRACEWKYRWDLLVTGTGHRPFQPTMPMVGGVRIALANPCALQVAEHYSSATARSAVGFMSLLG